MSTIKEALDKLGNTTASVAAKLRELGIKGYSGSSCSCPIAKYLHREGFPGVVVGTITRDGFDLMVAMRQAGNQSVGVVEMWNDNADLPFVVQVFIRAFDHGEYPDLEM